MDRGGESRRRSLVVGAEEISSRYTGDADSPSFGGEGRVRPTLESDRGVVATTLGVVVTGPGVRGRVRPYRVRDSLHL